MRPKYRVVRKSDRRLMHLYYAQIKRWWWPFWIDICDGSFSAEGAERIARLHLGVVVKELDMGQTEQDKFK